MRGSYEAITTMLSGMTADLLVRPEILDVPDYVGGERPPFLSPDPEQWATLPMASNENLFGPSPAALAAANAALTAFWQYPDPDCTELGAAISSRLAIAPDRLLFGNGSESLVELVFRALLRPGETVVIMSPTFPLYRICAAAVGAWVVDVPRTETMDIDPAAIASALAPSPRLVVLCTPNNPTGNAVTAQALRQVLDALQPGTMLLIDEAYQEYLQKAWRIDCLGELQARGSLSWMVLRTFSKAYGLAGLRLGYGIVSDAALAKHLRSIRGHFAINSIAQAAALAAWNDQEHLARIVELTISERERCMRHLSEVGCVLYPSQANFICIDATEIPGLEAPRLAAKGLFVKPLPRPNGRLIRVTIGRPNHNNRMLAIIEGSLDCKPLGHHRERA
jgi:histidinol-phosphate aminotransferase